MASVVDICNLALGHLGDTAEVSSIDPPEGSAQAAHCARFYPIARDSLLEMHTWGFATKRCTLAQLGEGWPEWDYSYAMPSDALNVIAVLPPDASDDYSISSGIPGTAGGGYVPQPFSCEVDEQGRQVVYTDQADAVLRYTGTVSDPTKFSPLFVQALTWHLASMLAGPIIKGDAGAAMARSCIQQMQYFLSKAVESDAGQRRIAPKHNVGWIAGR